MDGIYPWSIPVIARESILWGNEYRDAPVTGAALSRLGRLLNDEPAPASGNFAIHPLLTRYFYEQFPYQESIYEEVTRSHAMLVDGTADLALEIVSDRAWRDVLPSGGSRRQRGLVRSCVA
jgi:hypothetical protein